MKNVITTGKSYPVATYEGALAKAAEMGGTVDDFGEDTEEVGGITWADIHALENEHKNEHAASASVNAILNKVRRRNG